MNTLDKQYQDFKTALENALKQAEESQPMDEHAILQACEEAFKSGYRAGYSAGSQQGYAILDSTGCSGSDFYDDEPWVGHEDEYSAGW